jgi:lysophospholipase L1-like esterase
MHAGRIAHTAVPAVTCRDLPPASAKGGLAGVSPVRRACSRSRAGGLAGLVVGVFLAGCAASAASDGAVPIDEISGPAATAGGSTAAAEPTGTTGSEAAGSEAAASPDPVVEAVSDVLGGQASISRPVGDDGSRPRVSDDRVFILGDSITESAGPGYYDTIARQLLPLGWSTTIDAKSGRTTSQGLDVLRRRRRDIHDVAVVLLGHNDAVDPSAYRKRIDAIVDELAGVPLVLLLTNYEFEKGRDRMNDQLRVVDALHDNVELVDWNAVVRSTDGAVGPDGLHLTRTGARALGATIAVSLCLAPEGTSPATTAP